MERIRQLEAHGQVIELEGEVIAADLETLTGKILVFNNDYLEEDIYPFEVIESIASRYLFKEAFLNEVRIHCRLVNNSQIICLQITDLELR